MQWATAKLNRVVYGINVETKNKQKLYGAQVYSLMSDCFLWKMMSTHRK